MHKSLIETLKTNFPELTILENEKMSRHTTFKVGGPADIFVSPSIAEIIPLISLLRELECPYTVIGNGSNLLVRDEGIEGVVISLGKEASEIEVRGNDIEVEAGAMLSRLANAALEHSLGGLEFASGIPGSVGGAVVMNAGAYGGEIKDVIISARVLLENGSIEEWTNEELNLSYRHSRIMDEKAIVLSARFHLQPKNANEIKGLMDELKEKRISKQPLNFPSAGSTFKRPEGYFAGKLIEDAGLRGYTVGGAQVSEKHCGFVVNAKDATAEDILVLMRNVDSKVYEKFGVHLEPEVRIIGRRDL